jgi:hypothetical protein
MYDHELQRQRCKKLPRRRWLSVFRKQEYFLLLWQNALAYYTGGIVVVNSEV